MRWSKSLIPTLKEDPADAEAISHKLMVRAGLVRQERTGRISRCSLVASPIFTASLWLNRYSKYWQNQFDLLAASLAEIDERRPRKRRRTKETMR